MTEGLRSIERAPAPILRGAPRPPAVAVLPADEPMPACRPYAWRPFDRQWALVDARVCDRPRPSLWRTWSVQQRYLPSLLSGVMGVGPAALISDAVPDLHHFRGSYGGRDVVPLWRDAEATVPNITPDSKLVR